MAMLLDVLLLRIMHRYTSHTVLANPTKKKPIYGKTSADDPQIYIYMFIYIYIVQTRPCRLANLVICVCVCACLVPMVYPYHYVHV
jgi:hypothetical protein